MPSDAYRPSVARIDQARPDGPWLGAFLDMMTVERGASRHTLLAYRSDLAGLACFTTRKDMDWLTINHRTILDWLAEQEQAGAAPRSVARRLSSARQFFRFLVAEEWRQDNPISLIDGPKQRLSLPVDTDEDTVSALLAAARAWSGSAGTRAEAMLELLYATGMRVHELVSLRNNAFGPQEDGQSWLRLTGKGGRMRVVPIGDYAQAALQRYQPIRSVFLRKFCDDAGWLWPSRGQQGHLTRQHFARILKEIARRAGVEARRIHPHMLRHAFATHLLVHGADLRVVQTLLGHASITTTQTYTHLADTHLAKALRVHHPLSVTSKRK